MSARALRPVALVLLLAACTDSTSTATTTTERPPLVPTETLAAPTAPTTAPAVPDTLPVAFGEGCVVNRIPFQPTELPPGWDVTFNPWSGMDPVTQARGIIEIHHGAGLPAMTGTSNLTVLGRPATIGTNSEGLMVRVDLGADACDHWALIAEPATSEQTLRDIATHLTRFAVGEQTMNCPSANHVALSTDPGYQLVNGRLQLPVGRALQTSRSTLADGTAVLFAKAGLVFTAGEAFDLVVPLEWRGRLGIGWGSGAVPSTVVHVPACAAPAGGGALAFPGGFFTLRPVCVTVTMMLAGQAMPIPLGIGTPCPGQAPVEGPTET